MMYKASVTLNGQIQIITSEYNSKKDFAADLRRNGYKVQFVATPETFEAESDKYNERRERKNAIARYTRAAQKESAARAAETKETTEETTTEETTTEETTTEETTTETTTNNYQGVVSMMTKTKTILSVWIGNLGDYNAGILRGNWYDLDDYDLDELTTAVEELTNDGENDYFIADSMSDYGVEVSEYESLESLYEKYDIVNEIIDQYGENADDVITAFTETISSDLTDISGYEFYFYSDCYNMADVAYEIMDQTGGLDEMPEHLRNYFDFEAYGRDLEIEGRFYYAGDGTYVEIVG